MQWCKLSGRSYRFTWCHPSIDTVKQWTNCGLRPEAWGRSLLSWTFHFVPVFKSGLVPFAPTSTTLPVFFIAIVFHFHFMTFLFRPAQQQSKTACLNDFLSTRVEWRRNHVHYRVTVRAFKASLATISEWTLPCVAKLDICHEGAICCI